MVLKALLIYIYISTHTYKSKKKIKSISKHKSLSTFFIFLGGRTTWGSIWVRENKFRQPGGGGGRPKRKTASLAWLVHTSLWKQTLDSRAGLLSWSWHSKLYSVHNWQSKSLVNDRVSNFSKDFYSSLKKMMENSLRWHVSLDWARERIYFSH